MSNVSTRVIIIGRVFRNNSPRAGSSQSSVQHSHFAKASRNEVGRSRIPMARTRALKATPNARSLSRTRYFGALSQGKRFSDLARQPLGRRVAGHRKPQQAPTFVVENKKCEQLLKPNRRNHEQINRRNPLHMIAKEGLPRRGTM